MATFGQTIAEGRKALGLRQRELAARVIKKDGQPISPQYLNDLEKDRRNPPSDHLMQQFASALGIDPDILFLCAGSFPPDIRSADVPPDQAVEAFKAFRRKIQ
nr:helix-turn-helix transcriptional regulator [uncultured Rhodopila sp.]